MTVGGKKLTGRVTGGGRSLIRSRLPYVGFSLVGLKDPTLSGAGEDCFRGLYLEVSLALVGVASPA